MKRVITCLPLLLWWLCGAMAQDISQYEYWTDDDYASRSVVNSSGGDISMQVSTEQLSAGVHYFNFRACRSDGVWGNFYRYLYYIPMLKDAADGDVNVEYWLDDDLAGVKTKSAAGGSMSLTLDISSLSPGVHYFNCMPVTANGERGNMERYIFYIPLTFGQNATSPLKGYEYWLDDDYSGKQTSTSNVSNPMLTIDISSLKSGVHYFNFRAYNERGEYGNPVREIFYIPLIFEQNATSPLKGYEYWLDDDYSGKQTGTSNVSNPMLTIDISSLKSGVHYFNFRAYNERGEYGNPVREMFYIPQANPNTNAQLSKAEYWLDDDYASKVTVENSNTEQAYTIDISQLGPGVHYFNYRAFDNEGNPGSWIREFFYLTYGEQTSTSDKIDYEYWIDDNTANKVTGSGTGSEYMFSIDVAGLAPGKHTFNFRAKNVLDQWGDVFTEEFEITDDVVLDENSTNLPDVATGVNVNVKRTINAGNWSTICLPFAMTEEQCKEAFGSDVKIADFKGTESEFDGEDNVIGIKVKFQSVTSMEENHPYIIKVNEKITEFTADGVTIEPDERACIEFDNGETGSSRIVYSGFYGTYVANTVLDKFTLFLSDNKFYYSAGKTKIKAFRGYFAFHDILADVEGNSGAKIAFMVDDIPTHIENYAADRVYLEGAVYSIGGQLIGKNVNKNQLKKGVYIRDGKKFVVK